VAVEAEPVLPLSKGCDAGDGVLIVGCRDAKVTTVGANEDMSVVAECVDYLSQAGGLGLSG